MKHRNNGYLTLLSLWLGVMAFILAFSSSLLAEKYMEQIEMYRDAARAYCLAESALQMGIIEYQKEVSDSLPRRKEIFLQGADGLRDGEETYVICITPQENDGNYGFLTGVAKIGNTQMIKTSAVKFAAVYDAEEKNWNFTFLKYRS